MGAQFLIVFLKLTLATINYTENQAEYLTPKLNIPLRKDDSIFYPLFGIVQSRTKADHESEIILSNSIYFYYQSVRSYTNLFLAPLGEG